MTSRPTGDVRRTNAAARPTPLDVWVLSPWCPLLLPGAAGGSLRVETRRGLSFLVLAACLRWAALGEPFSAALLRTVSV